MHTLEPAGDYKCKKIRKTFVKGVGDGAGEKIYCG